MDVKRRPCQPASRTYAAGGRGAAGGAWISLRPRLPVLLVHLFGYRGGSFIFFPSQIYSLRLRCVCVQGHIRHFSADFGDTYSRVIKYLGNLKNERLDGPDKK